jgi:hypothetical protein
MSVVRRDGLPSCHHRIPFAEILETRLWKLISEKHHSALNTLGPVWIIFADTGSSPEWQSTSISGRPRFSDQSCPSHRPISAPTHRGRQTHQMTDCGLLISGLGGCEFVRKDAAAPGCFRSSGMNTGAHRNAC